MGLFVIMERMKHFKQITSSLRGKVLIRSTVVIVVLAILIGYLAIRQACGIEYENALHNNQILTRIMSDRFNENSEAFIHQIDFVTLDGEIGDLISGIGSTEAEQYYVRKELRSLITLRSIVMDAISGVYLYDDAGTLIIKWEKTPNREGNYSLPSAIDIGRYHSDGSVSAEFMDGHLVYHRAVRTLETRQTVGYISFLYDEEFLKQKLNVIAGEKSRFVGLYDSADGVLICGDEYDKEAYLRALQGQDLTGVNRGIRIQVDGMGTMLVCGNEVMNEGWYLLSAVRSEDIYEMQSLILLLVAAFVVLAVLVILAVTFLNRAIVTGPIGKMITAVQKVQNQEYEITLDIHTGDEIEILADNFNIMARRIDELVNQNLKAGLAYKEMQFSQLQHQIKPHFLYNTLECINALSQLGRTDDVRTMTGALAKLMKTKMSDRRFTTIREEFACVEAFLQIYKIMQGENLSYDIRIAPDCRDLSIPSLIVQPVVENAVLHGIVPSARKGTCTAEAFMEEGRLHIRVSDDGVGMPPEQLQAAQAFIAGDKDQGARLGIGIENVVERIRLIYGAAGEILLLSDREWGTTVELILPPRPAGQMDTESR